MKLIVVDRSKVETYNKLLEKFADDMDVCVVWDRRKKQTRQRSEMRSPDRRRGDRRRLRKDWHGRDYVVIHVVDEKNVKASVIS